MTRSTLPTRTPVFGKALSADPSTRTLRIIVSTPARDRQGDIVEPAGLDFRAFLDNPVVLWAHDLTRPPIGRILDIDVGTTAVTATVQFAETPFAREVFDLYAEGFLRAWSVGFLPLEWERLDEEDGRGFRILAAEVVEVSAVPVPANPETLTRTVAQVRHADLRKAILAASEEEGTPSAAAQPENAPAGAKPDTPTATRGAAVPSASVPAGSPSDAAVPLTAFLDKAAASIRKMTRLAVKQEIARQSGALPA